MAKKDDFDKIDTNKDGFISREEFDAADQSAGVEREKDALEIKPITLNNFEKELFNLILEIFDPSVPIVEKKI